jgi:hypothetical protein
MAQLPARTIKCGASLLRSGAQAAYRRAAIPTCAASAPLAAAAPSQTARLSTESVSDDRHAPLDTLRLYEQPALYDAAFSSLRQFSNEVHRTYISNPQSVECCMIRMQCIVCTSQLLLLPPQVDFLLDVAKQHVGRHPRSFLELGCIGFCKLC